MTVLELKIQKDLFSLQDLDYKVFSQKLIPTLNPDLIIGVRMPVLRKYAGDLAKTSEAASFLNILPHKYFEENNLHGALIEKIQDFTAAMNLTEIFLPHIDNWAVCDMFLPKVFKKYPDQMYQKIKTWLDSKHTYTIRYAIGMLLSNFLDKDFLEEMLELTANIRSTEYYVNMMIAWYFSTALVKQPYAAFSYIQQGRLSKWTHNKAIQKALESYRISDEMKAALRILKVK